MTRNVQLNKEKKLYPFLFQNKIRSYLFTTMKAWFILKKARCNNTISKHDYM